MTVQGGIRSILRNGSLVAGSAWIETMLRVFYIIMITRYLGSEGYGLWSYSVTVSGFILGFVVFGFEAVIYYSYGKSNEQGDKIVRTALFLRLIAASIGTVVLAAYALLAAPVEAVPGLMILLPLILGKGIVEIVRSAYIARQNVRRYFPTSVVFRLIEILSGMVLLWAGSGILAILAVHMLSYAGESVRGLYLLRTDYGIGITQPDQEAAKDLLRKGAPMAAINIGIGYLFAAPILYFGWLVSDFGQLGELSIALQIATMLLTLFDMFLLSAIPVVAHGDARGDTRLVYYGALLAVLILLSFGMISILLSYLAAPLLFILLGEGHLLAAELTVPAAVMAMMYLLPVGYHQVLVVRQRHAGLLFPTYAACGVMTAGMIAMGRDLSPQSVIWIACLAWGVRAIALIAVSIREK